MSELDTLRQRIELLRQARNALNEALQGMFEQEQASMQRIREGRAEPEDFAPTPGLLYDLGDLDDDRVSTPADYPLSGEDPLGLDGADPLA